MLLVSDFWKINKKFWCKSFVLDRKKNWCRCAWDRKRGIYPSLSIFKSFKTFEFLALVGNFPDLFPLKVWPCTPMKKPINNYPQRTFDIDSDVTPWSPSDSNKTAASSSNRRRCCANTRTTMTTDHRSINAPAKKRKLATPHHKNRPTGSAARHYSNKRNALAGPSSRPAVVDSGWLIICLKIDSNEFLSIKL